MGYTSFTGGKIDMLRPIIGLQLSDIAEGSIIYLNENGSPIEFYVAKHDYEPDLNGSGRTLLVRKECHSERKWHSSSNSAYATSDVDAWLNGDYKTLLDDPVQNAISATSFYYTIGYGDATQTTLSKSVFLLSLAELGLHLDTVNDDGSALPIASTLRMATLSGEAVDQWTRSVTKTGTKNVCKVSSSGDVTTPYCTYANGIRPCFTLPSTTIFNAETLLFKEVA